ncbi:hypothetical protein Dimus_010490, partial [Dionaea muscipula]
TMAEDGVSLGKPGCRRSSRISSLAPSSSSDLGKVKISGLQPSTEIGRSTGELAEEEGGVVPVQSGLASPVRVSDSFKDLGLGRDVVDPLAPSINGEILFSDGAQADVQVSLDCSPLVTGSLVDVPISLASSVVAGPVMVGGLPELGGDELPGPCVADGRGAGVLQHAAMVGGQKVTGVDDGSGAGGILPAAMIPVAVPAGVTTEVRDGNRVQLLCTVGQDGDLQKGAPLLAGAGLGNFQKAAGRGDPKSPLAQAALVGMGDRGGGGAGHSYASTVGSGRRANVRLHFVPSVKLDDGEELCMMDSDRDEMEWEPCLVGHFLQSGVPFSTVRPRLLHLWRAEGLVEVRTLDVGFFIFRFSSMEGRDKILEGGLGLLAASLCLFGSGNI